MARNIEDLIGEMPPKRQRQIEARAAELIAEEMTLRELRRAQKKTQAQIAKKLRLTQDNVSRLEQRSDMLLSTLGAAVKALGGDLSMIVKFPDRPAVRLTGFSNGVGARMKKKKKRSKVAAG